MDQDRYGGTQHTEKDTWGMNTRMCGPLYSVRLPTYRPTHRTSLESQMRARGGQLTGKVVPWGRSDAATDS